MLCKNIVNKYLYNTVDLYVNHLYICSTKQKGMKSIDEARKVIGKRLKHIRITRYEHLSINKIHQLTGLSRDIISRIETGEAKGNAKTYTIDSLLLYKSTFKKLRK